MCCSVLQRGVMSCSALQCVAVHCSALQCVAVRCSVVQCDTVRSSVFQSVAQCFKDCTRSLGLASSCVCPACIIHIFDISYSYVRHASLTCTCATRIIHTCDTSHSYAQNTTCICTMPDSHVRLAMGWLRLVGS